MAAKMFGSASSVCGGIGGICAPGYIIGTCAPPYGTIMGPGARPPPPRTIMSFRCSYISKLLAPVAGARPTRSDNASRGPARNDCYLGGNPCAEHLGRPYIIGHRC